MRRVDVGVVAQLRRIDDGFVVFHKLTRNWNVSVFAKSFEVDVTELDRERLRFVGGAARPARSRSSPRMRRTSAR